MDATPATPIPVAKPKRKKLKRILLIVGIFLLAVIIGLLLTYGRAAKEAWDLRGRIREALRRGEPIVGTVPARLVFADEYLRLLCGDNPTLLAAVQARISKAVAENPSLLDTEISALAVASEPDARGQPVNVVLYLVGELKDRIPQPKDDGSLREQLGSAELLKLSKSLLAIAGRDVQIYGEPAVAKEHRETLDAVLRGDVSLLDARMQTKRNLRAIIVNPGLLVPESVREGVTAIVFDLRGSMNGSDGDIYFFTKSNGDARDVETLLARWRTLVVNALRVRGGQRSSQLVTAFSATKIETRGSTAIVSGNFDSGIMALSLQAIRSTGRSIWAARNAPTDEEMRKLRNDPRPPR